MTALLTGKYRRIASINSPFRLLLLIIVSVCALEILTIYFLSYFNLTIWEFAIIDALFLFLILFLLLFLLMFRPLVNQIRERKKALKSLKISEDRYRSIFRNIQDVYYELSLEGIFIEVSPSIKYLSAGQYHRKDLLGKSVEILCIHDEEHKKFKEELMRVSYLTDYEFPLKNADGSIIQCSMTARLQCDSLNEPQKITGSIHDISRHKEIELELRRINDKLQTLIAEKDKLFSIIAHDLRSPFSAFLGLTALMAENGNKYKLHDLRRLAALVNSSANNLHQLLENLLQWSQIKQNSMTLKIERLHIYSLVKECIESVEMAANSKRITVYPIIPRDICAYGDEMMIKSVLRNLITNALKFTNRDGRIIVEAVSTDQTTVQISVADNGIGINPDMLNSLFHIDVKTSRPGTEGEPSTGLGLILCKEFVEKNNGTIWVESQVDKGSKFYFTLHKCD